MYDGCITVGSKLWQERVLALLNLMGKRPS